MRRWLVDVVRRSRTHNLPIAGDSVRSMMGRPGRDLMSMWRLLGLSPREMRVTSSSGTMRSGLPESELCEEKGRLAKSSRDGMRLPSTTTQFSTSESSESDEPLLVLDDQLLGGASASTSAMTALAEKIINACVLSTTRFLTQRRPSSCTSALPWRITSPERSCARADDLVCASLAACSASPLATPTARDLPRATPTAVCTAPPTVPTTPRLLSTCWPSSLP
mmetsp:Transcript_58645/g.138107  ORF Transcript_58645/g.138107 Transcript_58645/m.138107 type:complete len:222 (+) Transcript_58645:86-751(+)